MNLDNSFTFGIWLTLASAILRAVYARTIVESVSIYSNLFNVKAVQSLFLGISLSWLALSFL